ncbi:ATP-binding protein [Nakamurella antarctica]|uniref:ATP-binding protein n=2 Tax=Nakamurella antarctica TaxID=1902245 RepID=A0A3G8ZS69_9ACTN|nr:ATP-binding protein [Nakamurella antarctica]
MRRAVQATPHDAELRLHLSGLLIDAGGPLLLSEAVGHLAAVLQLSPGDERARTLMTQALGGVVEAPQDFAPTPVPPSGGPTAETTTPVPSDLTPAHPGPTFDWSRAEAELADVVGPQFTGPAIPGIQPPAGYRDPALPPAEVRTTEGSKQLSVSSLQRPTITLADVGGLQQVKDRLNAAFLAPLRNPDLRKLYGKSLRGGMLLYGPPGCGKTFLAKAIAGEMGASFLTAGLSEILEMWMGQSERNLHSLFEEARQAAPCVLFLDEIDALGAKRSLSRSPVMRNVVNQLLSEMDGVRSANEGVYIIAATNQPWDVDPALRRPGRLDRTLLVLPPDNQAREAIYRTHLASRPIENINLAELAAASEGLSGADIAYVCELAAEGVILDSLRSGTARLIRMTDLAAARAQVAPSTAAWLDSARNVVAYGQDDGTFAELKAYLKKSKRW